MISRFNIIKGYIGIILYSIRYYSATVNYELYNQNAKFQFDART